MFDVNGLSIQDIMNLESQELMRMNTEEIKAVTSRLASAANKRIKRAHQRGEYTPAMVQLEGEHGQIEHFSVKGKNLNQTRSEFARARNFLTSKTSTKKGYSKWLNEISQQTGYDYTKLTKKQQNHYWHTLAKAGERGQGFMANKKIWYAIWKVYDRTLEKQNPKQTRTFEKVQAQMEQYIDALYEKYGSQSLSWEDIDEKDFDVSFKRGQKVTLPGED